MTPVPLDLPLRPSEAAELAILIFEQAERKPLNDEVRNRLAARAAVLRLTPAAAPTSSIFYKPLLIGRMRRPNGPEIVVNAVPFGPSEHENLEKFVSGIGAAFHPRPQGVRPAIAVSSALAATAANPAASGRDFYYAGLCAAIRAPR